MSVDRYDMIVSNAGNYMEIRSDGDWVEIDDYEKLTAINAELLAACESAVWARFACPYDATNPNGAREKLKAAIANTQPQGELNDDD